MLQPKPFEVETQSGERKTYILHKFPAIQGREIIAKYPVSLMPKLGDYGVNEETMLKLMAFVGVERQGGEAPLMLTTRALVDNHVPDWETLARIEFAMIEYNCSFFANGKASTLSSAIAAKAQALLSQMLTDLLGPSSAKAKQL